jgi:hypothetical protein
LKRAPIREVSCLRRAGSIRVPIRMLPPVQTLGYSAENRCIFMRQSASIQRTKTGGSPTVTARFSCTSLAKASRTGHDLSLIEKPADSSEKNQPIPDRKISVCPIVKVVFPGLTSNIGTLLNDKCGVLDSLRQRLSLLARRHRTHILLPVRYQYGSWTHNLSLDPPYAGGTPDPPRVATRSHDSGRACPTGADDLTRR